MLTEGSIWPQPPKQKETNVTAACIPATLSTCTPQGINEAVPRGGRTMCCVGLTDVVLLRSP